MISIKIPQKGRKKNFKFSQELQKDKAFQTFSPTIYLQGLDKHFEHEYIIKPSKNLIQNPERLMNDLNAL